MQKEYDIQIREGHNFRDEILRISNMLHEEAAHYIVVRSKQHQSIHKFRICLKKLRGIIRLLRYEIPSESFVTLNTNYRDISRQVCKLRDYTSQITLLKKMHSQLKNSLLQTTLQRMIKNLTNKRKTEYDLFLNHGEDTYLQQMIINNKAEFQDLEFNGDPNIIILRNIKNTYNNANTIRQNEELWEKPEIFHSWRKQVKYFMFELMVIKQLCPKKIKACISKLNSLQKILGRLHDMHLFKEILIHDTYSEINANEKKILLRLACRKEKLLMQKAETFGNEIFKQSSLSFANRTDKLWNKKYPADTV